MLIPYLIIYVISLIWMKKICVLLMSIFGILFLWITFANLIDQTSYKLVLDEPEISGDKTKQINIRDSLDEGQMKTREDVTFNEKIENQSLKQTLEVLGKSFSYIRILIILIETIVLFVIVKFVWKENKIPDKKLIIVWILSSMLSIMVAELFIRIVEKLFGWEIVRLLYVIVWIFIIFMIFLSSPRNTAMGTIFRIRLMLVIIFSLIRILSPYYVKDIIVKNLFMALVEIFVIKYWLWVSRWKAILAGVACGLSSFIIYLLI